jgi:hypothetical protein
MVDLSPERVLPIAFSRMQANTIQLKTDNEQIESWDDDGDLQCAEDLQFHSTSTSTSVAGSVRRSGHRDSISSRRSARSDLESNAGDEDWQVLLRDNDEFATEEAIASARSAGIPIPNNVPKSALLGGTIKKIRSTHAKKNLVDDWSEDLEMPDIDGELAVKPLGDKDFADTLQQIGSSAQSSPSKYRSSFGFGSPLGSPLLTKPTETISTADKFQEDDGNFDTQDVPTIRVASSRSPQRPLLAASDGHLAKPETNVDTDDFEKDFELTSNDSVLRLTPPKEMVVTPSHNGDDWDIEWAEGSIGVRFGGTKRDGRSTHSSSVSALSPSVSSCLTVESEDDGFDGLVLPDGPLDLEESLKRRQEVPDEPSGAITTKVNDDNGEFFDDLDIGDDDVFTSTNQSVNQNIRRKEARPISPTRSAKTLTFTNKANSGTRIPRLSNHDRTHSNLEPVSESGAPITRFRRPHSRVSGHSSQLSVSSTHTVSPPSTPSSTGRRSLGSRMARETVHGDPTTTSAQLLKAKRSMPVIRTSQGSTPVLPFQRPSSRQDGANRPASGIRAKTPVDRTTTDSRLAVNRRHPLPFLPAGASQSQSQHVTVKHSRSLRRPDGYGSMDSTISQRSISRLSSFPRPETPGRYVGDIAGESMTAAAKHTVTRPTRRRNFGDGTELESFDDLPTSANAESRFEKNPIGHGAPRSLRSRPGQTTAASPSRINTPTISSNTLSPSRSSGFTPRFARDTNASRNAREQRIASLSLPIRDRDGGPLVPLSTNWQGEATSRNPDTFLNLRSKRSKVSRTSGSKPQLIRPMGSGVNEPKCKSAASITLPCHSLILFLQLLKG